jgi:signal transduction histidine kinase
VRRAAPVRSAPARALEAAALVLCTGAACMVGYVLNDGLPLFFITLPFGFWAAMRFPTVWAYAHAFAAGGFLLGVTLLGHGPFDGLGPTTAAYVAQLYIFVSFAVTALLALHRDETARLLEVLERSGDEARETAQLRDVVLAGMTDGIVVVDSSGRFVLQNRVGRELLGDVTGSYEDWGEAVGVSTLSGQRLMADEQPLARALRGETVIAHELTAQAGRGRDRELLVDAFPLALPGEERGGAVAVVRDVTDENVRREQLNRFVSVVAHDLKTPLTVFDGWLELLEEEGTNAAARARAVASMQSASTKMNRLITDLLAYSAAKDGETDPTVIDVGALAYAVGEPLVELAEKRGAGCVQLVVTANDLVHADRKQLEQVLDNIVGNAVKYADADRAARIEVSSRPAEDPDWVVVEVSDNGIGIPEAELDDIFTEFRRASNGMARASGSGLGLAICRRIVEAHGGTISARSADGAGTVFTFTLPAEPDADRVAAN